MSQCCSFCVSANGLTLLAANIDSPLGKPDKGLILANPRGAAKRAMHFTGIPTLDWTSRYASLTFTAFGRDWAGEGMNEKGLVIQPMSMFLSELPPVSADQPRLHTGQWLQFLLDTCDSVQQVLSEGIKRAAPIGHASHFLIADASGDCAGLEYLEGKPVIYHGASLPIRAMTNEPCQKSLAQIKEYAGFGGSQPLPSLDGPVSICPDLRFVRIMQWFKDREPREAPVEYCFGLLEKVAPTFNRRALVYDIAKRRVIFRTNVVTAIREVNMAHFDLSVEEPLMMQSVQVESQGDISASFVPLTASGNRTTADAFADLLLSFNRADANVPLLNMEFGAMMKAICQYERELMVD